MCGKFERFFSVLYLFKRVSIEKGGKKEVDYSGKNFILLGKSKAIVHRVERVLLYRL